MGRLTVFSDISIRPVETSREGAGTVGGLRYAWRMLPSGTDYDPWRHADELGLRVALADLEWANELWLPDHRTIVLRRSMRASHQRNALAHGIGHAVLGHRDDRPKHERQADRYAARRLIDPLALRALQAWTQDPAQIAAELGVTRRLLLAYWSDGTTAAESAAALVP